MSDDLVSVEEACERSAKRAKITRWCKKSSATLLKAAFLALLAERDNSKKCWEELTLKI